MLKSFIKNCLFGVNLRVTKAKTLLAAHDELFEYSLGHNLFYVYVLPPYGKDNPNASYLGKLQPIKNLILPN